MGFAVAARRSSAAPHSAPLPRPRRRTRARTPPPDDENESMRIGPALPTFGPDANAEGVADVSRSAEDLGYDSLWTGDRVLAPTSPSAPYPAGDGVMPRAYERHLDPVLSLALAAARARRVRLGTSTLNGLWQSPLALARSLTPLDVLGGGRLDVGLGLGWMPGAAVRRVVPRRHRGATRRVISEATKGE